MLQNSVIAAQSLKDFFYHRRTTLWTVYELFSKIFSKITQKFFKYSMLAVGKIGINFNL
jgi:hypothetical protein